MVSQRENNIQLIKKLFNSFDTGHMDAVRELLGENMHFQFGSFKPAIGVDAPGVVTADIFTRILRIEHEFLSVWAPEDNVVITEMWVTYHRDDGKQFRLPCANTFRIESGKISEYRIYMDVTPILS